VPDTLLFLLVLVVRAGPTPPAPRELEEAPTIPTEELEGGGGRDLEREREPTCVMERAWAWPWERDEGECKALEWMGDGVCRWATVEKWWNAEGGGLLAPELLVGEASVAAAAASGTGS
jgi:hypothetical protein